MTPFREEGYGLDNDEGGEMTPDEAVACVRREYQRMAEEHLDTDSPDDRLRSGLFTLLAERERLREALSSDALFLRRFLGKVEHKSVWAGGQCINGYAAAEVPDWEMLQRIDDIEAALAGKAQP